MLTSPYLCLHGMPCLINPMLDDVPRMTVSPSFAALMPADFVSDLNEWMIDFFGRENRIICLGGKTFVFGPKTLKALQGATC